MARTSPARADKTTAERLDALPGFRAHFSVRPGARMDRAREQWILEQLVLLPRSREGDAKRSKLSSELYFHYTRRIGPDAAQRHLDRRIRETRVKLVKRLKSNPELPPTPEPKAPNKGGAPAVKRARVLAEMLAMPWEELKSKKVLQGTKDFKCGPKLFEELRREVLAKA